MSGAYSLRSVVVVYLPTTNSRNAFQLFVAVKSSVQFGHLQCKVQEQYGKLSAEYEAEQRELEKIDIIFNFVGEIDFLSATQPKRQGA